MGEEARVAKKEKETKLIIGEGSCVAKSLVVIP